MTKTISGLLQSLCLIAVAGLSTSAFATISVTLSPSPSGPQPVGTVITWTATVSDTAPGTHEYRFSVGPAGGPLAIVSDFSLAHTLQWAFSQTEGTYKVKVRSPEHLEPNERQSREQIRGDVATDRRPRCGHPHSKPAGGTV